MSEPKKCYSLHEEDGYTDNLKDVIHEGWDTHWEKACPFELEIYEGDEEKITPTMILPELIDKIDDNLSDMCGDWSYPWFESLPKTLQKDFEIWFEKYLEENDCKIEFYNVENVKKVTYVVKSEDDYEVKK